MNNKTTFLLLIVCLIFAASLRIFTFSNTDHLDFESVFRIMDSYGRVQNPFVFLNTTQVITSGTGGQRGYYFLNSLLMSIFDNPVIVSKITSLLFGLLSIIPYYLLVKLAFSKEIALASVFALAFYSVHIQLSAVAMANTGSIFFIILSLYFLLKYLYFDSGQNSKYSILTSALFCLLATSFRMETWLFIPLATLIIKGEKKYLAAVIFFCLSSIYILNTLYLFNFSLDFLNNPIFHLNVAKLPSPVFNLLVTRPNILGQGDYQIFVWIHTLFHTLSLPLTICGFLGALLAFKNKKQRIFCLFFLSFFTLSTVRQIISNHQPFIRYSCILVIFFLPLIFLSIQKITTYLSLIFKLKKASRKIILRISLCASLLFFISFSTNLLSADIPQMQYDATAHALNNWAKRHLKSGDYIICGFSSLYLSGAATENSFTTYAIDYPLLFNIYDFLSAEDISKLDLNEKSSEQINIFEKKYQSLLKEKNLSHWLIIKRASQRNIKRIVLMLSNDDYIYIRRNFPNLLKKFKIKFNRLMYFGFLETTTLDVDESIF
ncbi:glycosyltransferase family 39 protein [Candidatus Omnitrophota bacterium]